MVTAEQVYHQAAKHDKITVVMKMAKQQSFGDYEYANKKKQTKKEIFLNAMEDLIPWDEWLALIRGHLKTPR
jgi:hypothetical protein